MKAYKLVSGYNVISFPQALSNVKSITVRKLGYRFDQTGQYIARLSIGSNDVHEYTDGITSSNYTMIFFNPSGLINSVVTYDNKTSETDVTFEYGKDMTQCILTFDIDSSSGGSPYVTQLNPLYVELEFA